VTTWATQKTASRLWPRLTLREQQEERWWEAEIARLRGVLLLRRPGTPPAEAETWLQRALDVARRQEAKALELRAAMSLSRLWQQQGNRAEAYGLLAPIYGWFTEGFDTVDLQAAKALSAALTSRDAGGHTLLTYRARCVCS
jgi:predicted ATPase